MGSTSNGCMSTMSKRKHIGRGRHRDEPPLLGIAARRALTRSANGRQTRCTTNGIQRRTLSNIVFNKYANRRTSLFKSSRPMKAPSMKATTRTHETLWDSDGRLFRIGDIVSVHDEEDDQLYFGQIRVLLSNAYGERFGALYWLVPKESAPNAHRFEAEHFAHAFSDSTTIPLEVYNFVQHAPSLPSYQHDWSLRFCIEQKMRHELEQRSKTIDNIPTKLIAFDEALDAFKKY